MVKELFATNTKTIRKFGAALVILAVAAIGTYLLVPGHAASPSAYIDASGGTPASGARAIQGCGGANSGNCVVFGSPGPMDGNVALSLLQSGTPFAANSFWNTPLPANTPVNSNTTAYVNAITYQLCHPNNAPSTDPCDTTTINGVLNSARWSVPFYIVPANQPNVPIVLNPTGSSQAATDLQTILNNPGVPIPADAHAAGGTDAHIAVYQPSSDTLWEFWRLSTPAQNAPGAGALPWNSLTPAPSYGDSQWHAVWGGVMSNVSTSDGIFPYPYAGWTTGLSLLGTVTRIEELQAGHIDHVMGIGLGQLLKQNVIPANNCPTGTPVDTPGATNGISWPADRSDGTNTDPCAIPEGLRFRLPANLDLNQYSLTPVAKTIAVAAQKYGFVVSETSDTTVGLILGDPTTYTTAGLPNPYTTGPGVGGVGSQGLFGGVGGANQNSVLMANFPWDQLQALPYNYGESGGP